jgi:hypothetical protein
MDHDPEIEQDLALAIEPDTKDWTWVLESECPECGFDAASVDPQETGARTRALGTAWAAVLQRADVRTRPLATVWSPLEYACHVRDVFELFDRRLELMLTEDGPHFPNWDQDETAVASEYSSQDPATVGAQLVAAAERAAARFDSVADDQWARTGFRSDGARFTIESFARYFLHDPVHHLWDVSALTGSAQTSM